MKDRMKASDVFAQSEFVFARKVTFAEAFPQVEHLEADVTLSGDFEPGHPRRYTEQTAGEYVDCVNPLCYNGGFNLGAILRDMIRQGQTDREGTALCQGNEGSPKGRRVYRKCLETFAYKIHVTLKPSAPDAATPPPPV